MGQPHTICTQTGELFIATSGLSFPCEVAYRHVKGTVETCNKESDIVAMIAALNLPIFLSKVEIEKYVSNMCDSTSLKKLAMAPLKGESIRQFQNRKNSHL